MTTEFEDDFDLVFYLYKWLNNAIKTVPKGRGASKSLTAFIHWQNILMSLLALMLGLTISLPEGKKKNPVVDDKQDSVETDEVSVF